MSAGEAIPVLWLAKGMGLEGAERLLSLAAAHVRVLFSESPDDVRRPLPAFGVLSSLHEGLPIALLKAVAAGVPMVATRVSGVPETMTDSREGYLVDARDADAFTAGIARLADYAGRGARMGEEESAPPHDSPSPRRSERPSTSTTPSSLAHPSVKVSL